MIKAENIEVTGFRAAIRGMRNPMKSWEKSDSEYHDGVVQLGPKDLGLAQLLFSGGTEHRKFLRMIHVSMDVVAPDYWWKEFSTYRVGVTENSTSTMHKLTSRQITAEDFSMEHVPAGEARKIVEAVEAKRQLYVETKEPDVWRELIEILPMSYNYRRTVDLNYENVFTMIRQRENHKLSEWWEFVEILKDLPYVREIGGLQ